jgi:hypothetical protein
MEWVAGRRSASSAAFFVPGSPWKAHCHFGEPGDSCLPWGWTARHGVGRTTVFWSARGRAQRRRRFGPARRGKSTDSHQDPNPFNGKPSGTSKSSTRTPPPMKRMAVRRNVPLSRPNCPGPRPRATSTVDAADDRRFFTVICGPTLTGTVRATFPPLPFQSR